MSLSFKKIEILSLTRDTFESSSIHAIPNIIKNKFITIKIVWIVCFLVSFSGCSWFMIKSINDYLQHNVVTSVRINYINEIKFPVIGICNLNYFNKKLASELIIEKIGEEYPEMNELTPLRFLTTYYSINNKTLFDFDPNDIIIDCNYGQASCNYTNDFEIYHDSLYGACLKFNSGKNMNGDMVDQKNVHHTGSSNGLELELFIGDVDKNNNIFSKEHGFNIFIRNQSEFDSFNMEGVEISPGISTRIILSRSSWKKQPEPYSDCTADLTSKDSYPSQIYKESFPTDRAYTYFDCSNLCVIHFIELKCDCSLNELQNNYRICYLDAKNVIKDFDCVNLAFKQFASDSSNIEKCDCPIECDNTYYTYSLSTSLFPTRKYSEYLLKSNLIRNKYPNITTHEELKKNVARIQIFFDGMKETVIEESVKTEMSDLISNLGGLLGLFLGLSFLSLIEFVEVFLQVVFVSFNKEKTHSENNK